MGPALAASGVPAEAVNSPEALHRQPHNVAAPIVEAYAESLTQVFLCAAPVAAVGFVVALFLREVPLRDIHGSAVDLGDGFGMPTTETPERMLENAIAACCAAIPVCGCAASRCDPIAELDVAGLWGVLRIYRYGQMYGTARLTDIAEYLRVPFEVLEPTFARLVGRRLRAARRRPDVADPGRGTSRSTTSTRCCWPGSSTSCLGRPVSRAGRTGARSRPRWSTSRIGFWPNVIGTTTGRRALARAPSRRVPE